MSGRIWLLWIWISLLVVGVAKGQDNGQKCRWVSAFSSPIHLDSLSVLPSSIKIVDYQGDTPKFSYDINTGLLKWNSHIEEDSVLVCYQTLPFQFNKPYYKRSLAQYDSNAYFADYKRVIGGQVNEKREELFATDQLHKTGAITRGLSLGSNQNVFVNSALNLQLEGKLTDEVNIRASITDQNVPFQPEGNTRQLQEFDRVLIELYNDKLSLSAGDVVFQNKASHFLRYYKNVQGGQFESNYMIGEKTKATTSVGASMAKGKFASIFIDPIEGVQGPYRLRGPNDERFIIVLSNSEKVFLDGRLLERGFDYDYTIDYNLGEVTFTPKIVITQFSRIRVDFEYSDRNYSRTILNASHYQQTGKADVFFNYYSEKDNPNRPLLFQLRDDEKLLLSQIGDNANQAIISGADSVGFSKEQILYQKLDTLDGNGQRHTIYRHSNNPNRAVYHLSFMFVGMGKGNYVQKNTLANGRVYEWVAPVSGIPQGDYEPGLLIPTPDKRQMVTAGAGYQLTKYDRVFTEMAFSDHDRNLFSNIDNENNQGGAVKTGFVSEGRPLIGKYKLKTAIDYEYNQKYFRPIDRFRYIEFDRDWNFEPSQSEELYDDHIFGLGAGLEKDALNQVNYRMVRRNRGDDVNGFQQYANLAQKMGRLQLVSDWFMMNNQRPHESADWVRLNAEASYRSRIFVPGYRYSVDKNKVVHAASDSVLRTSMYFEEHQVFLRSNDTLQTRFNLNYSIREDKAPFAGELLSNNLAHMANVGMQTTIKSHTQLGTTLTYRHMEHLNNNMSSRFEKNILGRLDWSGDYFKNHLRSELTYTVANGRELRREFVFLQVPTGEGTHTWRDDNGDGVKDLNEFYEAVNPDEKNYVKIFVPTDEYVQAYTNNFHYRFNVDMPRSWRNGTGLKKFLSKFSNNSSWNIEKRISDEDIMARLVPFIKDIREEDLISVRESIRSTFFYDRANPKFGMDGTLLNTGRKQLLMSGFESRATRQYTLNSRYNIQRVYNVRLETMQSSQSSFSDFLSGRDFEISSYRFKPELAWQPGSHFRFTTAYAHTNKENVLNQESAEKARFDELQLDLRLTRVSQSTFNANLRLVQIGFKGEENTAVGYELLEALRPGRNLVWTFNLQQKILSGLQMNLTYEGRKSPNTPLVHVGRVQVSALF
jgi:hypothetical protein